MTTKQRIPTFHVVPHFNFAAKGGALQLGRVYKDLLEMAPMNKKPEHCVDVDEDEIYPPTTQSGFEATTSQLLTGEFGIWAKALGVGGAGAGAGAEKSVYESASCTSVVTFYFDPDEDYVSRCLSVKPVEDYMAGAGRKRPAVFLLTGLKVAKKLKFHTEASRGMHAEAEGGVHIPQEPVKLEAKAELAAQKAKVLGFETDDIVVGFRVAKYQRKKPSIFGKKKEEKSVGGLYIEGAEMLDDENVTKTAPRWEYEEVPIPEELKAQEVAREGQGENAEIAECWVEPAE
ncbi:hypothetical protein CEP54_009628 [Fusarium duplospermum]|uniref:Uncharacterized protein n=1 Tax=Fusarium duplospermum TaxID=1325734 RepID=A0A428PP65_9HYPO|nr:hypothetical protein CEP54_009628 [Fusarium duplospermum]